MDEPDGRRGSGRRLASSVSRQLARHGPALLVLLGAGFLALVLGAWVAARADFPLPALTRDPSAIARQPWFYGFFSNLGVILWAGASGFLAIGSIVERRRHGSTPEASFLGWFAGVTLVLVLDDLYMVHEAAYPSLLPGPQEIPIALYGALFAGALLVHRRLVLATDWVLLAVATGLLGTSVLVDVAVSRPTPLAHYVEDGFKLLGILVWVYYFATCTIRYLADEG